MPSWILPFANAFQWRVQRGCNGTLWDSQTCFFSYCGSTGVAKVTPGRRGNHTHYIYCNAFPKAIDATPVCMKWEATKRAGVDERGGAAASRPRCPITGEVLRRRQFVTPPAVCVSALWPQSPPMIPGELLYGVFWWESHGSINSSVGKKKQNSFLEFLKEETAEAKTIICRFWRWLTDCRVYREVRCEEKKHFPLNRRLACVFEQEHL